MCQHFLLPLYVTYKNYITKHNIWFLCHSSSLNWKEIIHLSELNKMNNHLFPTCAGKKYKAQS